jgi:hypothetical protein
MNPPVRYILSALTLGSLFMVVSVQTATANPAPRVGRLDQLVTLTNEQKTAATQIFQTEEDALAAIPAAERLEKGETARKTARQQLRALLTPQQRNKYDLAPQAMGGGLRSNPDNILDRLDQLVKLTPEQKQRARQILWNELADQLAAVPEGGELQGFFWREPTRDLLRAIFTPEQLAKYNSTPQGQGGGATGRSGLAPKAN